jgi:hypothetical protein
MLVFAPGDQEVKRRLMIGAVANTCKRPRVFTPKPLEIWIGQPLRAVDISGSTKLEEADAIMPAIIPYIGRKRSRRLARLIAGGFGERILCG